MSCFSFLIIIYINRSLCIPYLFTRFPIEIFIFFNLIELIYCNIPYRVTKYSREISALRLGISYPQLTSESKKELQFLIADI